MRVDIIVLLIHLLVIAVIDYKQHIIPDQLVMSLVVFKIGYDLIVNYSFMTMLTNIGCSLLITIPLLLLTVWMEKKTGKFQMGGGDVKLLGLIAFYLTPFDVLVSLLIASVLQLVALKYTKMQILPLAPALFISTLIVVFML